MMGNNGLKKGLYSATIILIIMIAIIVTPKQVKADSKIDTAVSLR